MNPYAELGKIVGGVGIVAGVVLLFVNPFWGVVVLLVVGIIGAGNMRRARERRHRELLKNQGQSKPTPAETPSATGRLEELSKLKESGVISEDEYEAKRQEILDGL